MATPSPIKPLSDEALRPMTPAGFQQDPKDRPLGSRARLRGRNVVWAGSSYGWQSAASFEKLRKEDRLPRPDTGQPLGERGRAEAAAERNAGPLKPLVQFMNWGKSPDMSGPRIIGGPINALSRLGNAVGDVVQGKKVDTSDAWVIPDAVLDDPRNNPTRAKYQVMDRLLGVPEPVARQRSLEVTPADVAARPAAGELGAQIAAGVLTAGLGTAATGASALLAKAPALAKLSKVVGVVPKVTTALTPTSATTKAGALARLGVATAAEQIPAAMMTDYLEGGSTANAINDLSVQLGGPRFAPGEIDPKRDDYLEAWKKGVSWDVGTALSLVGGLSLFPAVRRASYGDLSKLPEDVAAATAVPEAAADGAAPPASAGASPDPVAPAAPGAAAAVPSPEGVAAAAPAADTGAGLMGERVATARYQEEQAGITRRAEARAALVAEGHLEDLGDDAFDFPAPPAMVDDGVATVATPGQVGAAAADAAGADSPVQSQASGAQAAATAQALPDVDELETLPEGMADIRPEADSVWMQLQQLGDEQLETTWDRQLTPEDAGIDVVARQQELDQQQAAIEQERAQVAAELERNQRQQALIPPRVQPDGPLVPAGTPLFHGTGADVAQQIAASGFQPSKSAESVFGEGVYFSPSDRYASSYAIGSDGAEGLLLQGQVPEGVNLLDLPATGMSTSDWLKANGLKKKSELRSWAQERGYDGVLFDPDSTAKPKAGGDPTAAHDVVVFDANVADNMVGNANAKPIGAYTPSYEELAGGDTRGKGVFFHGAAADIRLEEGYYSGRNIYGEGFYATDDVRTAATYQKKNKKSAGPNAEPAVYQVAEKQPVNFFDLDQPIEPSVKRLLEQLAENSESFANALDELDGGGVNTMAQFMDEVRASSRSAGESADTITELFESLKDDLRQAGYGGFTHQGGKLGGRGNRLHQVNIYWEPENQLDIQKLAAPEPIGPVDLTALQRQLDEVQSRATTVERDRARLQMLQQPPELPVADAAEMSRRDLGAVADQLDGGEVPRFLDEEGRRRYVNDLMRVAIQRGEVQPPVTPLPGRLNVPKDERLAELFLRDHYLAQDARTAQAQIDAWKATVAYDDLDFEGKKQAGLMQRGFEESAAGPDAYPDPWADKPAAGNQPMAGIEIPAAAARPLKANREMSAAESVLSWVNSGVPGDRQAVGSVDDALALVRAKGQVLDPDAIPGLDMKTARNDKAMGRSTPATEAVAQAYREFYGIESSRPRVEPFDPNGEYLRVDTDGNLWTSKGPVVPTEGELKALKERVAAETAARAVQAEANSARLAELQAQIAQLKNDAFKGGC